MPPNTSGIIAAAHRRRELTRAKVIQALRELDHAGTPITFEAIAHAAGVSRSWPYTQSDIRAEIQRLRAAAQRATATPIPAAQRTSEASTQVRLQAALRRNRELVEDNQRLRRQLAQALGERRQDPSHTTRATARTQPRRRTSLLGNDQPMPPASQ